MDRQRAKKRELREMFKGIPDDPKTQIDKADRKMARVSARLRKTKSDDPQRVKCIFQLHVLAEEMISAQRDLERDTLRYLPDHKRWADELERDMREALVGIPLAEPNRGNGWLN